MFTKPSQRSENPSGPRNLVLSLALVCAASAAGVLALVSPASAQQGGQTSGNNVVTSGRDGHGGHHPRPPRPGAGISPYISPAARQIRHSSSTNVPCTSGNFCASVWDPTTGDWKIFDLFDCHTYALSYWQGPGQYNNAQVGGVRVEFQDQNHNILRSFTATGTGTQNWDPVWFIKNC